MTATHSGADVSANPLYLDARGCGSRYAVSSRHWLRLVDAGRARQPARFGRLVRWHVPTLEAWEAAGCPTVRHVAAKGVTR